MAQARPPAARVLQPSLSTEQTAAGVWAASLEGKLRPRGRGLVQAPVPLLVIPEPVAKVSGMENAVPWDQGGSLWCPSRLWHQPLCWESLGKSHLCGPQCPHLGTGDHSCPAGFSKLGAAGAGGGAPMALGQESSASGEPLGAGGGLSVLYRGHVHTRFLQASSFPLFCFSLPTSPSMAQTRKHRAGLAELGAQEEFACLGP